MKKWYLVILALSLLFVAVALSCEVERKCFICPNSCYPDILNQDTLFVTGFELGKDPTELGGSLDKWHDTLSNIQVATWYDTTGGGAWGSQYYAKLEIIGNDGESLTHWSGGGLVLNLTDCLGGIDLSDYDLLQFEIKTFPGSKLDQTNIKMQGAEIELVKNDSTPERPISQYGHFPGVEWETISVPLDSFNVLHHWEHWVPFDRIHALRFVTTTINRFSPDSLDGMLGIDNVRFVKN